MRIELHCHSTCSDGTLAADVVAARAEAAGAQLFALTDHDTCAGSSVRVAGARNVRGVEMSCDDGGRTFHVLAYDRGGDWSVLEAKLDAVREARRNRLRVMAAKLVPRGVRIAIEPLLAEAGRRSVGRPDLARAMVAAGHATSMKEPSRATCSTAARSTCRITRCRSSTRLPRGAPPAPRCRSRIRTSTAIAVRRSCASIAATA